MTEHTGGLKARTTPPADGEPAIRFEHVTKSFKANKVLDDVSFDVPRATAFCLLGRSGTGKSVTLKHIIGLIRPDEGKVYVEGRDITALDARVCIESTMPMARPAVMMSGAEREPNW